MACVPVGNAVIFLGNCSIEPGPCFLVPPFSSQFLIGNNAAQDGVLQAMYLTCSVERSGTVQV